MATSAGAARTPRRRSGRARGVVGIARRAVVTIVGFAVVVVGIILMPLPGPGMLIVAAGIGILSTEYRWAQRLFRRVRRELTEVSRQLSGSWRARRQRRQRIAGRPPLR